nr:uncharacterized protein LOC111986769 [Quercus suber]
MSLYNQNDALMCKVFLSILGPIALRWFNGLRNGSIHNFGELIQELGARFMTCSRVPQLVDALLSMKMGAEETLRSYANRYWELFNEIGRGNEKVVASTFKLGLPEDSELQELLTMRPLENMRQLMRRIEEYNRLEDDRRELRIQEPDARTGEINVAFQELVHKILERIQNESFFWWPNKTRGDLTRRNQSLYRIYHQDKGHTTEQCRMFKDHLEQLVKSGHLKEFVVNPRNEVSGQASRSRGNVLPPPLGVIEVIHAVSVCTSVGHRKGVLIVVPAKDGKEDVRLKKKMKLTRETDCL